MFYAKSLLDHYLWGQKSSKIFAFGGQLLSLYTYYVITYQFCPESQFFKLMWILPLKFAFIIKSPLDHDIRAKILKIFACGEQIYNNYLISIILYQFYSERSIFLIDSKTSGIYSYYELLLDHCMGLFHKKWLFNYSAVQDWDFLRRKIAMLKIIFGMLRTKIERKSAPMQLITTGRYSPVLRNKM